MNAVGLWFQWIAFLLVTGYALFLFWQAVYHRYLYIRLGRPAAVEMRIKERLASFFVQVFGHKKLLKDHRSGVMHAVIFYGFIVLQFGALDIIVKGLGMKRLPVPGYEAFGLTQEITVGLVLIAIAYAAYRRYGEKLKRLKQDWKPGIVIYFITGIMLTVWLTLGFERLHLELGPSGFAPLSSGLAVVLAGMSPGMAALGYWVSWWLHLVLLLAFLVYVPQSKHFHLITAPINLWLGRTEPAGRLSKLDLDDEEAESFGAGKIEDFTRKQMLDLYACVECGRCTNVCPASNTGKLLSPMELIVKLRDHLTDKGAAVTSKSPWVPRFAFSTGQTDVPEQSLIGDVITEEEIWACTTCRNCEDQCPVGNEHVDKIVDMRRHLVLMEGQMPSDGQRALQNIERQGNPWGLNRNDRSKWTVELEGIEVPTVTACPDFEILLFVGSMGSYDMRSRKVTRAFVRLMQKAQVRFAILGNEERGSGDTPRRMGNELLFQQLCADNIAVFRKYGVKKIVTACPHTYNTLKNEYPDFGLDDVEVMHHTELLASLLQEGKLVPEYEVAERVTYHDSCYLGRYNKVYDPPRAILEAIPGIQVIEMELSRDNGMCCGAGGGMMWMEETAGARVNVTRTEQALAVNPTVIGSACPYCLTMLEDGTKQMEVEEQVKARDVAELLALSVFGAQ